MILWIYHLFGYAYPVNLTLQWMSNAVNTSKTHGVLQLFKYITNILQAGILSRWHGQIYWKWLRCLLPVYVIHDTYISIYVYLYIWCDPTHDSFTAQENYTHTHTHTHTHTNTLSQSAWNAYTHIYDKTYLTPGYLRGDGLEAGMKKKTVQLERLRSEIPPAAPWLPILVIHIRSQVKRRQGQRYKFKKNAQN